MTKADEQIKRVATDAAKTVLQDAAIAKVKLDTETAGNIQRIQADISEMKEILKTNTVSKEEFRPIQDQVIDHEARIRAIERWVWGAVGVLAVAEVVIGWYVVNHR